MDIGTVTVVHRRDAEFAVGIRGHELTLDQPAEAGGCDAGPTPTELFVGAIAGCVAHYAASYLRRHNLQSALTVSADYSLAAAPTRIGRIEVRIVVPDLAVEHRARLLAVARHCTLHNTLENAPTVTVDLDDFGASSLTAAAS